jgi:hypothetical protein
MDCITNWLDQAEESILYIEDKVEEIVHVGNNNKNQINFQELWDLIKRTNLKVHRGYGHPKTEGM